MQVTTYKPDISVIVLGMAITVMFPLVLSLFIVSFLPDGVPKVVLSRVMFWLELGCMALYARKLEHQPLLLWKQAAYSWYFYSFWIVVLVAGAFGALKFSAVPDMLGWQENSVLLTYWMGVVTAKWWLLLLCAITPAITEELLFRGYLLSRFQSLFNSKVLPVFLSAFLCSNLHFKLFSLRETLFSFLLALILGFHYQRYQNIYIIIIVRFLVTITLFLLYRQGLLKLQY